MALTRWTGKAGNSRMDDPGNWDNGVPAAASDIEETPLDIAAQYLLSEVVAAITEPPEPVTEPPE